MRDAIYRLWSWVIAFISGDRCRLRVSSGGCVRSAQQKLSRIEQVVEVEGLVDKRLNAELARGWPGFGGHDQYRDTGAVRVCVQHAQEFASVHFWQLKIEHDQVWWTSVHTGQCRGPRLDVNNVVSARPERGRDGTT